MDAGNINNSNELNVRGQLFRGLDSISKKEGRIYKKNTAHGVEFFQAKGFFSKVISFLFSKRLDYNDLIECATRRKFLTGESPERETLPKDPISSLGHIR